MWWSPGRYPSMMCLIGSEAEPQEEEWVCQAFSHVGTAQRWVGLGELAVLSPLSFTNPCRAHIFSSETCPVDLIASAGRKGGGFDFCNFMLSQDSVPDLLGK